jgi:mannose-6-phosphate isomerase-like protein (cupin superfamily)
MMLAALTCWSTAATADDRSAEFTSTSEIVRSVAHTVDGSAYKLLKTDSSTPVYVIRRDGPGKVEVHRTLNDVIIMREGTVTVLIGENVEGNQEIKPNEWLGGKIIGGRTYKLAPGDVLYIPAGLGHLITPSPGGSVTYLVVKTAVK